MGREILSLYYAAFNRRDKQSMLDLLTGDVIHEPSQGGTRKGRDAFAEFLDHMSRCYEEEVFDPVYLAVPSGHRAAAEFMLRGTYLETDGGLPAATEPQYLIRARAFFELSEGMIARVSDHYNMSNWLAQVNA